METIETRYDAIFGKKEYELHNQTEIRSLPFYIPRLRNQTSIFVFNHDQVGVLHANEASEYYRHISIANLLTQMRSATPLQAAIVSGTKDHAEFADRQLYSHGVTVMGIHAFDYGNVTINFRHLFSNPRTAFTIHYERDVVVYPHEQQVLVRTLDGHVQQVGSFEVMPPREKALSKAA